MELESSKLRRLSFVKYLYSVAVRQSHSPAPMNSASLLTFHDAVELFLQLSSEHLDAGGSRLRFMEYWELLSAKIEDGKIGQKESMRRLNKARVALKHHGTRPSQLDVEAFRASTTNFFEENTPVVFGIEFESISLIDLVQPKDVREKLEVCQQRIREGNFDSAVEQAALSFEMLLDDYESRKTDRFGESPFFFGRDMTRMGSFGLDIRRGRDASEVEQKLEKFVDRVKDSIEAMQKAMKVIALGIDYRRYSKFSLLTPNILKTRDGKRHIYESQQQLVANKENVQFCIEFVVETALKLQEFDYNLNASDQLDF